MRKKRGEPYVPQWIGLHGKIIGHARFRIKKALRRLGEYIFQIHKGRIDIKGMQDYRKRAPKNQRRENRMIQSFGGKIQTIGRVKLKRKNSIGARFNTCNLAGAKFRQFC
jgi:hypothetical protein